MACSPDIMKRRQSGIYHGKFTGNDAFSCLTVLIIISLIFPSLTNATELVKGYPVYACGDGAERPPYTYFKRENNHKGEAAGYDADILKEIFSKYNIKVIVELPPWKRCLEMTKNGSRYQIALSASYNVRRFRNYLMTRSYYTLTPYYFYSTRRYPDGPGIKKPADLNRHYLCGLKSYNYFNFGVDNSRVHRPADNFPSLIAETLRGKCDIFLARYEILAGFEHIGKKYLSGDIGYAPVPDAAGEEFYMLISKQWRYASQFKRLLNKGITELERKGRLNEIFRKHSGRERPMDTKN